MEVAGGYTARCESLDAPPRPVVRYGSKRPEPFLSSRFPNPDRLTGSRDDSGVRNLEMIRMPQADV